jgi:hypothetical protein
MTEWRTDKPPEDGTMVLVPQSWRYVFYKPDGRRQMGTKGRWQRATDYGWENTGCAPEIWAVDNLSKGKLDK